MKSSLITLLFFTVIFSACAPVKPAQESTALLLIDATVRSIAGTEVSVEMKLPELSTTSESFITDIAKQTVQKSLLLEGIKTEVNGVPAIVKTVRSTMVSLGFETAPPFSIGSTVKMLMPRKTLAIMDFEVVRGNKKDVGRATLEGLTSALINSGHFIVVERSKLKTVLDEQALSLTGAAKEPSEKLVGQLLTADLILTGSLAEVSGNTWDINLRLVNVRTGQAMGAIAIRTPLFKPQELRDAGALEDDFEEDSINPSWVTGYQHRGMFNVALDTLQGAEGTKHSLKMAFDFSGEMSAPVFATMANQRKRDLSLFSGIEFFIKADQPLTGLCSFWTSMPDDPNRMDSWVSRFDISTDWKRVRIPFESLTIARRWIKRGAEQAGAKPGDQILRLDRVESTRIGVDSALNPPIKGTIWLDKVRFYRD
jgi:curli biogenesis system outer membrane secretion channel CsgG